MCVYGVLNADYKYLFSSCFVPDLVFCIFPTFRDLLVINYPCGLGSLGQASGIL